MLVAQLFQHVRQGLHDVRTTERVDGPSARHFRARQIQAVLNLLPVVFLGNLVATFTIAVTFWDLFGPWLMIAWVAVSVLSLWAFDRGWRGFIRGAARPLAPARALRWITAHAGLYALAWGALPAAAFPLTTHHGELLIAPVLVGMMCAGGLILSPIPAAAAAYVVGIAVTSVVALQRSSYDNNLSLLTLLAAYTLTVLAVSWLTARTFFSRLRGEAESDRQRQLIDLLLKDFEEHASDWLWEVSVGGRLRHVSSRLAQSFGLAPERLMAQSFTELLSAMLPPGQPEARILFNELVTHLHLGRPFRELELPVVVNGKQRWWSLMAKPLFDERGRAAGWRGVGSDVTDARHARDELARLANVDALTGLANRYSFGNELARVCELAAESGQRCALMYLDLDNFKSINDSLGHAVGDQLLRCVADRLRVCVSVGDLVARLGGDEFAVLTWQTTSESAVSELAERILVALAAPCQLREVRVEVRASIGLALAPRDGLDPQALQQCADLALYAAKGAGRNTFRFFSPPMADSARARARLQQELGVALAEEQFEVFFQPQVALSTGGVVAFEALVRWQHAERGLISPSEFVPVAEETGQIVSLGTWVLKQACLAATTWPAALRVAVNLSAVQFRSQTIVNIVDQVLADTGLDPARLELEITESALIEDHDGARATLMALRSRGVRVALDDFGTGYSSLAYLRRFPMDQLKIDGMFVRSLVQDSDAQAVVTAIISLARALRLETTAEGVENQAQWDLLTAMGCDLVQGYLASRPMPGGDIPAYLARFPLSLG